MLHRTILFLFLLLVLTGKLLTQDLYFTNVTNQAGINHEHGYETSLIPVTLRVTSGMAVGDYDKDGFPDIYFERGDIGPNMLYRNLGNGRFEDQALAAGLDLPNYQGAGPLFADYDGDGWSDLLLGGLNGSRVRIFQNQQDGTFLETTAATGINLNENTYAFSAGDIDRDGDLDLYMSHWLSPQNPTSIWKNKGDGSFYSADEEMGFLIHNPFYELNYAFAGHLTDVNNDNFPDLLISSDFFTSQVWINRNGQRFERQTEQRLTDENGMGTSVGDYDNDGDLDWFVASIFDHDGSEGNWGATGNRLYQNQGDGSFEEVSREAGIRNGGWAWGASFADFNNDGFLDLVHTNGWSQQFENDSTRIFLSNQDGTFSDVSIAVGVIDTAQGRGLSILDYDRDGDLDFVIANYLGQPSLWRNDYTGSNHYLTVQPRVTTAKLVGAKIRIHHNGRTQYREIRCGNNYNGQNMPEAHFGLGSSQTVDSLTIDWADGTKKVMYNISGNQILEVDDSNTDLNIGEWTVSPNPFNEFIDFSGRLGTSDYQTVSLSLSDMQGREIWQIPVEEINGAGHWRALWESTTANLSTSRGVYVAKLWVDGELVKVQKLVRQ